MEVVEVLADAEDKGRDDAVAIQDTASTPAKIGACQSFSAASLAAVLPCQTTDTCCSTALQFDPCATGTNVTTAPSRWQVFRFWTPESPACVDGKAVYFRLYPREPWQGESSINTLTWAPTCSGATRAMDWASIRWSEDGLVPTEDDVQVMASPFAKNYNPCGVARVGKTKVVVLGCDQHSGGGTPNPEFWTMLGNGTCCLSGNAFAMIDSGTVQSAVAPPLGFNRWGLPTAVPSEAKTATNSLDVVALAIKAKHFDLPWHEYAVDGFVDSMRATRLSSHGGQLKTIVTVGPAESDYGIDDREIAVHDVDNMAWTFDPYAPARFGSGAGDASHMPSLAMVIAGEPKQSGLEDATADTQTWLSRVVTSNGGYLVMTPKRFFRVDKNGKVLLASNLESIALDDKEYLYPLVLASAPDGGAITVTYRQLSDLKAAFPFARVLRLDSKGKEVWSWKMDDTLAWARPTRFVLHNGILHVFGILVPKTNDSTWAWHLRLDAATGKELCPGQMPGKP